MGLWSGRSSEDWAARRASWATRSKKDPRFNMKGIAGGVISSSLAMDTAIRAKAAELNVEPPDDIEMYAGKE